MRQLIEQLRQATGQYRPSEGHDRRIEVRRQEQRKDDHGDVEQRRHEGRYRKTVPGVEDGPGQRGQRDQQYIRKRHSQQAGGQLEFFRSINKTGGCSPDHPRRRYHPEHSDQRQHQRQQTGNVSNESPRRLLALLAFVFRQDRHERLGKSPLGKDPPQQVGQLEGNEKGIRGHAGAEYAGDEGVTDKPQNPGNHRDRADGSQGFEQVH
ncbi:hypothetical protein D3C84_828540 [compost metagenome]